MSRMKVLLLGEYSGFYLNLKQGLQELGVEVKLVANGDGWKQIPGADEPVFLERDESKIKKIYNRLIIPELNKNKYKDYDVVQLVTEGIYRPYINSDMIRTLKKNNGKLFVNIAGNHSTLYQSWKDGKLGYYTYDNNPEKAGPFTEKGFRQEMTRRSERYVDKIADGVIPVMYEYAVGIRHWENCRETIPLPFNAKEIQYQENKVGDKLVFYHGLLRPKDKGGEYITEALETLKKKYPNDVEIHIHKQLPLKEYLEVISKTNVLLDQCKEHCWGMNACYGMALGKVVLGGASRNSLKEFGLKESPVLHVKPDVNQILSQLEYVLENRKNVTQWGYESRKFVEEFHDAKRIAQKYLDTWKK